MSKLYKCEKCLREFVRKQHLIQHYSRKIPCVNPPNHIIYYKDIFPHAIRSGNIIVNKILPTEQLQVENPAEVRAESIPEPKAESIPEPTAESLPETKAEPIPDPKAETIKKVQENMQPHLTQESIKNNRQPNLDSKKHHNKTVKANLKNVKRALEKINEYDELYKRVMKYFDSEQIKLALQEENITNPVNPNITLVELRGLYKKFQNQIENEYYKIRILD